MVGRARRIPGRLVDRAELPADGDWCRRLAMCTTGAVAIGAATACHRLSPQDRGIKLRSNGATKGRGCRAGATRPRPQGVAQHSGSFGWAVAREAGGVPGRVSSWTRRGDGGTIRPPAAHERCGTAQGGVVGGCAHSDRAMEQPHVGYLTDLRSVALPRVRGFGGDASSLVTSHTVTGLYGAATSSIEGESYRHRQRPQRGYQTARRRRVLIDPGTRYSAA